MAFFASDNTAPAHPKVLASLVDANKGYQFAYGEDTITHQAKNLFKQHFGEDIEVFFTSTGTASNVLALKSVLSSFEAVICAQSAHLNKDECGAPEACMGTKLITIDTRDGKLTPELIAAILPEYNMVHRVKPKIVSISQCTEWGTVYSLEELDALVRFCHNAGLLLHVDGARLANAACHLNVSLKEICLNGAIDMLSFGGSKNGALFAEAVVLFNQRSVDKTPYIQKQLMQLHSKMRYISAQFIALLTDNLWYENAFHANEMALKLFNEIKNDVELVVPVQSNVLFVRLTKAAIQPLQAVFPFAVWNEANNIVRWMTSWNTTGDAVDVFAKKIKEVVHGS